MKKIIGIVLILASVLISCSKDDENASIVGTWDKNQLGKISTDGTITDLTNHIHNCTTEKDNFTFVANGDFVIETLSNNAVSTKEKSMESNTCLSDIFTGKFTVINNNDLYVAFSNNVSVGNGNYEIISVTNSELKLKVKSTSTSPKSKQTSTVNNYLTFTRR
jgi:hypothetical protein